MAQRGFSIRKAAACILPVAAGLVLSTVTALPSRAAENYTIPASESEGYGIGDCMQSGSACGRVMADSWCEAHGHAHVLAFGTTEDVTGAIKASADQTLVPGTVPIAAAAPSARPGDVVIRCGD